MIYSILVLDTVLLFQNVIVAIGLFLFLTSLTILLESKRSRVQSYLTQRPSVTYSIIYHDECHMIIERAISCLLTSLYGCIFHKTFIHDHRQENLRSRGFISRPRVSLPDSFWSIESFTQKASWTSCHYCERLSCGTFRYVSWTPSSKKSTASRTSGLKHDIRNVFPRICRVVICENHSLFFALMELLFLDTRSTNTCFEEGTHSRKSILKRNTRGQLLYCYIAVNTVVFAS